MQLLANLDDRVGKLPVTIHDVVPAVPVHQVSIASYQHNINRPGAVGVIEPKGMVQIRDKSSLDCNIVNVKFVPLVASAREVMVENVRHDDLHSVIRGVLVRLVLDHARGAEELSS